MARAAQRRGNTAAKPAAKSEPPEAPLDCQACGACCCNSEENKAERYIDYVEVKPRDALSKRPELVAKLCVINSKSETHLKLIGREQRCIALAGVLGEEVRCSIYEVRPKPCRTVEAGSDECHARRRDQKLE